MLSTITFIIYLLVMFGVGYIAYGRTESVADYILGGRKLGPLAGALSAGASDMSGWLLLGLPGLAVTTGLASLWLAVGLLVGTWLNWLLLAKRLRVYSVEVGDALTLPDYFEKRFVDKSHLLRLVSSIFILLFFLLYTASGLVAAGKLFETVFGFNYQWAVILGASAVMSYTIFGGFLAVSWTDVIQGLLMMLALVIVPVMAVLGYGGVEAVFSTIEQQPYLLSIWTDTSGESMDWVAIVSLLGWGLGYFGQPHILARFKSIECVSDIPKARRIAITWSSLSMLGAVLVGLMGVVVLQDIKDAEKVFILLVELLFHPLVAGVLLAAILAAIMSTADSQLLVASSVLSQDVYPLLARSVSLNNRLWVGRVAVVVICVLATWLALGESMGVLDLVSYAWAGFGAAFGPLILLSLYYRNMTAQGALAGMLVGGLTVILWKQLSGGIFDLYEIIPGFIFSCIAIVLCSTLTMGKSREASKQFEQIYTKLK